MSLRAAEQRLGQHDVALAIPEADVRLADVSERLRHRHPIDRDVHTRL